MKNIFAIILFVFACLNVAWADQPSYEVDTTESLAAPWKVGEVLVTGHLGSDGEGLQMERKFVGITTDGLYLVQEFYSQSGQKYTDLFVMGESGLMQEDTFERNPMGEIKDWDHVIGSIAIYAQDGSKLFEGSYDFDGNASGHWIMWRNEQANEKFWEGDFSDNEKVGEWKTWDWEQSGGRLTVSNMGK